MKYNPHIPLVSIVTPFTFDRNDMMLQLKKMIELQTYPNIEWIQVSGAGNIGHKRNYGCKMAKGEIIVHMDSDDRYAADWVEKITNALALTPNAIIGLNVAYFADDKGNKWLWNSPGSQPYVCEATMCYYKRIWEKHPFLDVMTGEGIDFCTNHMVRPFAYLNGFQALIHDGNTISQKALPMMKYLGDKKV